MGFLLDRNLEDFKYDLYYEGQLLKRYETLSSALEEAQKKSKNNTANLYITKACVSDWYLGFPKESEQKVIAFYSPEGISEEAKNQYKFIEGPFENETEARMASRKITGQEAVRGD